MQVQRWSACLVGSVLFFSAAALHASETNRPQARSGYSMAWDTARNVLVLHGGIVAEGRLSDTWEWNGTAWKLVSEDAPAALSDHALVYDAAREQTLLFGGRDGDKNLFGETWAWDGTSWKRFNVVSPPARNLFEMEYDPIREVVVLYGGTGADGSQLADTWEWDGSQWTRAAGEGPGPGPRGSYAMCFLPGFDEVIITGGWSNSGDTDDVWSWNGQRWLKLDRPPTGRLHHSLIFDPQRNVLIQYGGFGPDGRTGDHFEYDGSSWKKVEDLEPDPGIRAEHEMVLMPGKGILLFGGITGSEMSFEKRERMNDLWLLDESGWKKLN